jgi:hypothetical protein
MDKALKDLRRLKEKVGGRNKVAYLVGYNRSYIGRVLKGEKPMTEELIGKLRAFCEKMRRFTRLRPEGGDGVCCRCSADRHRRNKRLPRGGGGLDRRGRGDNCGYRRFRVLNHAWMRTLHVRDVRFSTLSHHHL